MERYPVDRDNRPVMPHELGLAPSQLDPDLPENWNNHHLRWTAREYASRPVMAPLRLLEFEQVGMLKDQHNMGKLALHYLYLPPPMPTLKQAMNRLEVAYESGERFKVYDKNIWAYTHEEFTRDKWEQIKREYAEQRSLGYE